jgi:hypothetical protein
MVFDNFVGSFDYEAGNFESCLFGEALLWLNSPSLQKANASMQKPRSPGYQSERGERSSLVGIKRGVFRDADHGEDFSKVWGKTTNGHGLAGFIGLHQHLDDQRDAGGVEVFDALEVEQNALVNGLVERLVGPNDRVLGQGGDVSGKAEAGDLLAASARELLLGDFIRRLHLIHSPYSSG